MELRADIDSEITEILYSLGFRAKLLGFHYIRRGIMLAIEAGGGKLVMKKLYDDIAAEFQTTASCVERSMRHAVKLAWEHKEELDGFRRLPPFMLNSSPRNSMLITFIAEELRTNQSGCFQKPSPIIRLDHKGAYTGF